MSIQANISLLLHKEEAIAQQIHCVFQRSYQVEAQLLGVSEKVFPPLQRGYKAIQSSPTLFYGYWEMETLAALTEIELDDQLLSICSFMVDPAFFRKGIASKLLHFILENSTWDKAMVETGVDNQPAISLYKKFGFKEEKRWLIEELGVEKLRMIQNRGYF